MTDHVWRAWASCWALEMYKIKRYTPSAPPDLALVVTSASTLPAADQVTPGAHLRTTFEAAAWRLAATPGSNGDFTRASSGDSEPMSGDGVFGLP